MRKSTQTLMNVLNNSGSSNSVAINAGQLIGASFVVTPGDATVEGTITIQVSNEPIPDSFAFPGNAFVPTQWASLADATFAVTAGASGAILLETPCYQWIRVQWAQTTPGTGARLVVNATLQSI